MIITDYFTTTINQMVNIDPKLPTYFLLSHHVVVVGLKLVEFKLNSSLFYSQYIYILQRF